MVDSTGDAGCSVTFSLVLPLNKSLLFWNFFSVMRNVLIYFMISHEAFSYKTIIQMV